MELMFGNLKQVLNCVDKHNFQLPYVMSYIKL